MQSYFLLTKSEECLWFLSSSQVLSSAMFSEATDAEQALIQGRVWSLEAAAEVRDLEIWPFQFSVARCQACYKSN